MENISSIAIHSLMLREGGSIYVAGPMTDIVEANYPAFRAAGKRLEKQGWDVKNPVDNANLDIDPENWVLYMHAGIFQLIQCSVIYMLRDWEKSRGARMEFNLACDLKMKILFERDDTSVLPYAVEWTK